MIELARRYDKPERIGVNGGLFLSMIVDNNYRSRLALHSQTTMHRKVDVERYAGVQSSPCANKTQVFSCNRFSNLRG